MQGRYEQASVGDAIQLDESSLSADTCCTYIVIKLQTVFTFFAVKLMTYRASMTA